MSLSVLKIRIKDRENTDLSVLLKVINASPSLKP